MKRACLQGKIPRLREPKHLSHLEQVHPATWRERKQLIVPHIQGSGTRHRKPGTGCVPVPTAQRTQAKQCRTAAAWMLPSHLLHLIILGSVMSHIHNASNTSTRQNKAEADEQQCSPQHFGLGMPPTVVPYCWYPCWFPPSLGLSKQNQKGCISTDCYKGELGLHYPVELVMKSSISSHPRAPEHSTYQRLANCLLLRSKNQLCFFVTPWLTRRGPWGKGKYFPGKKLLTSEGRKPNSTPHASASNSGCSACPVQAWWKEQPGPEWVGRDGQLLTDTGRAAALLGGESKFLQLTYPTDLLQLKLQEKKCEHKLHDTTWVTQPKSDLSSKWGKISWSVWWQSGLASKNIELPRICFSVLCALPGERMFLSLQTLTHGTRADRLFPNCFGHCLLSPGILNYNF